MHKIEMIETLKAFGIKESSDFIMDGTRIEPVYEWHGLKFSFCKRDYSCDVRGDVPLEVWDNLNMKFPFNKLIIRVRGEGDYIIPIDRINANVLEHKGIIRYNCCTKEGLIAFLCEVKDYYKDDSIDGDYDQMLTRINSSILKTINPSITGFDWMQGDKKHRASYNTSYISFLDEDYGFDIRKLVEEFDKSVNPFTDNVITIDEYLNNHNNVVISCDTDYEKNGNDELNCQMTIKQESFCFVTYDRHVNGFSYKLFYDFGDSNRFYVTHQYLNGGYFSEEEGEIIKFSEDSDYGECSNIFNITNNKFYENRREIPHTDYRVNGLKDELKRAIYIARSITSNNMNSNNDAKVYEFTNGSDNSN